MDHQVKDFISKNQEVSGSIFVLKGFKVEDFDVEQMALEKTISNKIERLLSISNNPKKIISYDEFICLYDLVLMQFKKIYILENGIYLNLFPKEVLIPDNILTALLDHFDEEKGKDTPIGDISEYLNIYSNFIKTDMGIACCYNLSEDSLKVEKIERYVFGKESEDIPKIESLSDDLTYINLCNDIDYYQLVRQLIKTNYSFAVTWENYISGKDIMKRKLHLLVASFQERVFEYISPNVVQPKHCNDEIYGLLKQYWGQANFRNLLVYDIKELERHSKSVVEISQERIICDIVEQVEHCVKGEIFRDIFVTAPTGAGKSLMFQIPAMYLAQKYGLLTLVVTPLIGLMNDQVQALKRRGYSWARTINSDISPVIKQEIIEEVSQGKCHIIYLSPESLLSRSDIEQLIGRRKIGLFVVDEAHIVTTWGKQFRPDYWYLGDHVQKLRRAQAKKEEDPSPFMIATFTATAIYEGSEDMYHETLNSLHMVDPITYLGYVRRDNIAIEISEVEVKRNKVEYEMNKFDALVDMINTALMRNQKTLIYFPTVALINRFHDYCYSKNMSKYVSKYHGQLDPSEKEENFKAFLNGERQIMLATKAFGMGIDIPDIAIVSHFAPTGNVCDYMQEIGRAARDSNIEGHAIYKHMNNDFKHINKLHGLSAIRKYQLVEVIKKILELYINSRYSKQSATTKKRNEMLVDAESFAYIFEGPQNDESELINKVKTAMLLIQKDYENRGFAPFYMRPIPLFAYGYFSITTEEQGRLNKKYYGASKLIFHPKNICELNLKIIWEKSYEKEMSFPKFKFLLYTKSPDLDFNQKFSIKPAMSVEIYMENNNDSIYKKIIEALKGITNTSVSHNKYLSENEMISLLSEQCSMNRYRAESVIGVFLAALEIYQRKYSKRLNTRMFSVRAMQNGKISYQFTNAIREFFGWLSCGYGHIKENTSNQKMFIIDENNGTQRQQVLTVLGILESFGVLRFKSLGGSNSQIYIYVNETKNMQIVRDKPNSYKNRLLDMINRRHEDSVRMLSFLFQNNLTNEEIWEHLENYFLGILPKELSENQPSTILDIEFISVLLQIGDDLREDYSNWSEVNAALFGNDKIALFHEHRIPLAEYYAAKLIIGDEAIDAQLVWPESKIIISSGEEPIELTRIATQNGWKCFPINQIDILAIADALRGENDG